MTTDKDDAFVRPAILTRTNSARPALNGDTSAAGVAEEVDS